MSPVFSPLSSLKPFPLWPSLSVPAALHDLKLLHPSVIHVLFIGILCDDEDLIGSILCVSACVCLFWSVLYILFDFIPFIGLDSLFISNFALLIARRVKLRADLLTPLEEAAPEELPAVQNIRNWAMGVELVMLGGGGLMIWEVKAHISRPLHKSSQIKTQSEMGWGKLPQHPAPQALKLPLLAFQAEGVCLNSAELQSRIQTTSV